MWRRLEGYSVRYNECREKQAAAKQTFVFHKPLTNESPAIAGSGARERGIRESMRHISASWRKKTCFAPSLFVRSAIQTHMLRMFRQCILDLTLHSQNRSFF